MIVETTDRVPWSGTLRPPAWERWRRTLGLAIAAALAGLVAAGLVAAGLWYVVIGVVLAVPTLVLLHRRPMICVALWVLLGPIVAVTDDGGVRKLYWIFHRALPLVTLLLIVVSTWAGLRERPRIRLRPAEWFMAGYVAITTVSILYTAGAPLETSYTLYDRVVAPMCLYLIVRRTDPDERDLRVLLVPMLFLLVTQSVIGAISWIAPGMLPAEWLVNVGRTSGSLQDPDLFAVALLFAGMYLLHFGLRLGKGRWTNAGLLLALILALFMAFLSYERAAWLAAVIVAAAMLYVFRRSALKVVPVAVLALVILLSSGVLNGPLTYASGRLHSPEADESALARLPPALAAVRMFMLKPITGWGYDQFDRFSTPFQGRVGALVVPRKVHASHNAYLTVIAEQGAVGFLLLLGPLFAWLVATLSLVRRMRTDREQRTRFLAICWVGVLTFIVVNNFENMKTTFGLGLWWLMLGFIAASVERGRRTAELDGASTQPAPLGEGSA
jgi:O-antigen ligase